jgi:hypothetical protein
LGEDGEQNKNEINKDGKREKLRIRAERERDREGKPESKNKWRERNI